MQDSQSMGGPSWGFDWIVFFLNSVCMLLRRLYPHPFFACIQTLCELLHSMEWHGVSGLVIALHVIACLHLHLLGGSRLVFCSPSRIEYNNSICLLHLIPMVV